MKTDLPPSGPGLPTSGPGLSTSGTGRTGSGGLGPARIALVVLVQVAVLAAVPVRQAVTRGFGTSVTLQSRDDDMMQWYVGSTLPLEFPVTVPDDRAGSFHWDERGWLTVRRGEPAWEFVSFGRDKPPARQDTVSIRARFRYESVLLVGARQMFVPVHQRAALERAGGRTYPEVLVDLRVLGPFTEVISIRVNGERFGEEP